MRLPLSNGQKVVGFWLVMTGGGCSLSPKWPQLGDNGDNSRQTYRVMQLYNAVRFKKTSFITLLDNLEVFCFFLYYYTLQSC